MGVIFAHNADPDVRDALKVLLDHRRAQAGDLYREYRDYNGYRSGQTKNQFLTMNGAGPGTVDPKKMPYYLLIVGDPESIPFSFQYQLDVQFAVGRIHFDTAEEYGRYATAVVAAESQGLALPRRAAFFGVQNAADDATSLSANHLVRPLSVWMKEQQNEWTIDTVLRQDATKSRLGGLLGGDETSALLFTATHGAVFDAGHPLQRQHQGALVCQEWPGPFSQDQGATVTPDYYFAAEDVEDNALVHGLLTFHFACYGAGTPRYDDFAHRTIGITSRPEIAPSAFISALPKRLLSHPKGGALAVVGHVERAWGCSFAWGGQTKSQLSTFESTLNLLLDGYPVGAALEDLNQRYSELSSDLSTVLEDIHYGKVVDDLALSSLWTANNDARGYAIIGDPAVRLCTATGDATVTGRSTILTTRSNSAVPLNVAASAASPGVGAKPTDAAVISATPSSGSTVTSSASSGLTGGAIQPEDQIHLAATVRRLTDRMVAALEQVVESTTVTVTTYQTGELARAKAGGGGVEDDHLRAVTRIGPDGDLDVYVPLDVSQHDPAIWQRHLDMVRLAHAHRAELLKATLDAAGALLSRLPVA